MLPYDLLKAVQDRLDFNTVDQKRLQEMGLWLMPYSVWLAKAFYEPLEKVQNNRVYLNALPGQRTKLRLLVGEWYADIFNGRYDANYAQRRWTVGVAHARLNISLVVMVNAVETVYRFSARQLGESANWLKGPLTGYIGSLTKMLNLDLAFLAQSYLETLPPTSIDVLSVDARTCQGLMTYETGELLSEARPNYLVV